MAEEKAKDLLHKAEKIHKRIFSVDSHTDTPMRLMEKDFDIAKRHDPQQNNSRIDFPRMREGRLDAAFFAVFTSQGQRTPEYYAKAKERANLIIDSIYSMLDKHPGEAGLAVTPKNAYRLKRHGKLAIFLGMENGCPVGNNLDLIREYWGKGVRYITLCHTKNNDICDSSTDTAEFNGLSEFGKNMVLVMNKTGMMIDVSHISDKSYYDVLSITKAPVIASHSCARAICNNPRNLSDDMLKALAKNDGVIQVCILPDYVKPPETKRPATVSDVADHIDHIVKTAGICHVGIGTDFDGGGGVAGCFDASEMKNITVELLKRGYSVNDIRKIWGGNLFRVMNKVQKVADKLNPPCHCR